MIDVRAVARALNGNVVARDTVVAPGPGHSHKDRSLSVRLVNGDFVVFSHAGDDWQTCKDYVRERLGWPAWQPGDGRDRRVALSRVESFDRAVIDADAPTPRRRRRWRYTPSRIDNRTRAARRAKALREHFTAALTAAGRELTVDLTERVMKASELVALAEDLRARMLRADPSANADDLVRLQRLADASVRRLNLSSAASKQPGLSDYLASTRASDEAAA